MPAYLHLRKCECTVPQLKNHHVVMQDVFVRPGGPHRGCITIRIMQFINAYYH